MTRLPPLRFTPLLRERPWGGRRLESWGKVLPPIVPVGESWELSDRPDAQSLVAEGPYQGRALRDLLQEHGASLLGTALDPGPFPLLVKLLDAQDWLSIQVHPTAETAGKGEQAKTEAWYVLEGGEILLGLKKGSSPEDLRGPHLEKHLYRYAVHPGDAVLVPAGAPHAIGPGVFLAEVQENSDTTHRLHDWGRAGRALHVEEALRDIRSARAEPPPGPLKSEASLCCSAFSLSRLDLDGPVKRATMKDRFEILGVTDGSCRISWEGGEAEALRGTWWMLPASLGRYTLQGKATLLEVVP